MSRKPDDVNAARAADPDVWDHNGMTALHRAAMAGDPFNVDRFIQEGADLNARDITGRTPLLHVAAAANGARSVDRLLKAGADPNVRDREGLSPLHEAAFTENAPKAGHREWRSKNSARRAASVPSNPLDKCVINCIQRKSVVS